MGRERRTKEREGERRRERGRATKRPKTTETMKVCVTGANGQTGSYVVQKLVAKAEVDVVPIVRSEAAKKALVDKIGISEDKVVVSSYDAKSLEGCFTGCTSL